MAERERISDERQNRTTMDFSSTNPRNPQRFPFENKCSKASDARDIDVFKMSPFLSEGHLFLIGVAFHTSRDLYWGFETRGKNSGIFPFQSGF
ncbi:hypothetical protein CEXT_447201 [Caerostris extrusa]|uniref:Ycf15 n=1 Tax=Caerostris extrusa TaxID=172846 RepID=A0AAV4XKK6_CAEEX|nr:hypothetical protein CEXT_447201 [Caerostris extrusa]